MPQVQLNEKIFNIDVADHHKAWELGLGGRDGMDEDSGMLFIYPLPLRQKFWMKGMKFPIDIVFVDENFKVVFVHRDCQVDDGHDIMNVYDSFVPIRYVLEVNAGQANEVNIDDMLVIS